MIKQLKIILKLALLLSLIILSSCEKDLYEEPIYQSKINLERVSLKDKNSKTKINDNLFKAVLSLKNINKNLAGRIVYDSISDIYYDDEDGIKITKDEYESYTFKVIKEGGNLENLLFTKDSIGDFIPYFVKYGYTKEELETIDIEILKQRDIEFINLSEEKFGIFEWICVDTYELIDNGDLVGADSPSVYEWVWSGSHCSLSIDASGIGGSDDIASVSIITTPNVGNNGGGGNTIAVANPCNKIKNLNDKFSSMSQSLQTLGATVTQSYENGIFIDESSTAATPNPIQTIPNTSINGGTLNINMNPTYKYVMIAHTHDAVGSYGTGTYSIFSWDDLTTLNTLIKNNHIDTTNFVFILMTADGTRYALTVDDPVAFADFFYDPSNLPFGTDVDMEKYEKLDRLFKKYYDRYKGGLIHTMSNPTEDKKNFLKFIKEAKLGVSLFEVDSTYTNFQKLSISNNGIVSTKNCN